MDKKWLSKHIYYSNDLDKLLLKLVQPLVNDLLEEANITQFFFIRYNEGGLHLRLRLLLSTNTKKATIDPLIDKRINKFLKLNPSKISLATENTTLSNNNQYENDTIIQIKYLPENDRYGGEIGVKIAENHFFHSSKTILEILNLHKESKGLSNLRLALILHTIFLYNISLDLDEMKSIAKNIFSVRFPATLRLVNIHSRTQYSYHAIMKKFNSSFEKQSSSLLAILLPILSNLHLNKSLPNSWMTKWSNHCENINLQLDKNIEKINVSTMDNLDTKHLTKRTIDYFIIFESYVHMNNNRLGISNINEAFLQYLIFKTLSNVPK